MNLKGPYLSLEEEKDNFCVVFTYPIKQACEIWKFQVTGVKQRQEMYKIAWCMCKFVVLSIKTYYFFRRSPSVAIVVGFVVIQK